MEITKKLIGNELLKFLASGKNSEQIAQAMFEYMNCPVDDNETKSILLKLCMMEEGEEFECSELELKVLAYLLLSGETNVEQKCDDILRSNNIPTNLDKKLHEFENMVFVSQELMNNLLFYDMPIQKMELNLMDKIITIYLDYVFINEKNGIHLKDKTNNMLGNGKLMIKDWKELKGFSCVLR